MTILNQIKKQVIFLAIVDIIISYSLYVLLIKSNISENEQMCFTFLFFIYLPIGLGMMYNILKDFETIVRPAVYGEEDEEDEEEESYEDFMNEYEG